VKSYGQRCPLARALDLVGERWTLLVVRELLLGPRRYTDLLDGLPGVGTNILAARLADLQEAQLVRKTTLPRPTAVTVYELTEAGRSLAPSIRALSEWGEQHGTPASADQAVRPAWILTSMARHGGRMEPGSSCELRIGPDVFELAATDDKLSVSAGSARSPDAVLTLEPDVLYALAARKVTPRAASRRIDVEGDPDVAAQVLEALTASLSTNEAST
jgi:DNA-binding HxlR family transcriptional regulator